MNDVNEEEFEEWDEEPEVCAGACEFDAEPAANPAQPAAVIYLPGAPGQGWSLYTIYRPQPTAPTIRRRPIGFL